MSKVSKPSLRAVTPGETAKKEVPKTIKEAVAMGERDLLVALRVRTAVEIDAGVAAAYLAPLMRQLRDLDKEIRALDVRDERDAERGGPVADETFDSSAI